VARLLPCGESAVLVEVDGLEEVLALHAALAARSLPGLADLVPAARTVLVVAETAAALPALREGVRAVLDEPALRGPRRPGALASVRVVTVEVRYDGEDLAEVAHHTGLTPDEVVAAHTASSWTAAFSGFAPGFAYLTGGDPRLHVPRRTEPRTRVPAGAVGLAGPFSGVYPRASPGGWQVIGHTEAVLWDLDRDPPALLPPGVRVRFVAVGEGPGRR
jgi:KipI family sensor histidine kinase inhibitor